MVASHAQFRFVAASLSFLLSVAPISRAQESWPKGIEACGDTSNVLLKPNGKVLWFSAKQTKAMSINRVAPEYPKFCRCQVTIVIAVFVDSNGKVACTQAISGHPLLTAISLKAAEQWTFKPMKKRGANVSFVGLVAFTFKSYGEVTY